MAFSSKLFNSVLKKFIQLNSNISEVYYIFRSPKRLKILGFTKDSVIPSIKINVGQCQQHIFCRVIQTHHLVFFERYRHFNKDNKLKSKNHVAVVIDENTLYNYPALLKKNSANYYRLTKKAIERGYIMEQFCFSNHTPDILAIEKSLKIRSFGIVPDALFQTLNKLGGKPVEFKPIIPPDCPYHWKLFFGIFIPEDNYKQGDIIVNKKLVAYACLVRIGNIVRYRTFMGHGQYLKQGIMILLQFKIVEWLTDSHNALAQGVQYFMYGHIEQGNDGLFFWKRKALFDARMISFE